MSWFCNARAPEQTGFLQDVECRTSAGRTRRKREDRPLLVIPSVQFCFPMNCVLSGGVAVMNEMCEHDSAAASGAAEQTHTGEV